jgi:hypothetical protein
MKDFKIRASACHSIMGVKGLGKTGESYLQLWLKEHIYNRKKEFSSKYTQKGLICEDDSIDTVIDLLNLDITTTKNEIYKENDFCTGTCDILLDNLIIDVKNSWDFSTFPLFEKDIPNDSYYWQSQVYMYLYDKHTYKLIYTLNDTPINIIEKEAKNYCYTNGYDLLDNEILEMFINKMTYSDIEKEYKIKVFDIERNDSDIEKIIQRVKDSRNYIKSILNN